MFPHVIFTSAEIHDMNSEWGGINMLLHDYHVIQLTRMFVSLMPGNTCQRLGRSQDYMILAGLDSYESFHNSISCNQLVHCSIIIYIVSLDESSKNNDVYD